MTKLSLTLRCHWKAALGWGAVVIIGAGYALWSSLAPVAQAHTPDNQSKPSMVACAVIAVEMSKTKCVRITAPTAERAVATCANYEEYDWEYDSDLGSWEEVVNVVDCGCERVNACLDAIETYGWANLGVFADLIPREAPPR